VSADAEGEGLLAALGLRRGEAAEVLHQHLMARRARKSGGAPEIPGLVGPADGAGGTGTGRPSRPATSAELLEVLRGYAARKAAFGELIRQGKLPPHPTD
jgi:hypothetical protein